MGDDVRRVQFQFASGEVVWAKLADFHDSQLIRELADMDSGSVITVTLDESVVTCSEFSEWVLPFVAEGTDATEGLRDTIESKLSSRPDSAMHVLLLGQTLIMSSLVHWGARSLAHYIHTATKEELVATFLDDEPARLKRERATDV